MLFLCQLWRKLIRQAPGKVSLFLGTLLLISQAWPLWAQRFQELYTGQVVNVLDGDTITLLTTDYEQLRVRFYGVDAPEKNQAFGPQSREALQNLIGGRNVTVEVVDTDRYSRQVGLVRQDGHLINQVMVAGGWAWVYPQYCKLARLCPGLVAAEKQARSQGLGLWSDQNPIPPWQWRRGARSGSPAPDQRGGAVVPIGGSLRGNVSSHIFHNSSCKHYSCRNCVRIFKTREEALKAGFRACKICGG
ncbi:MAG: thermonuclease family protein [Deltaproteobacteria bacterium]|jgi:endonuclease YncB( thermonuclease family)|nr:thermonuclease family protein [Deltaproteobacteria bacterium]